MYQDVIVLEREYRRGCHQAVAALNEIMADARDPREVAGLFEDVLKEMRESPERIPAYIHEARARLAARLGASV